MPIERKLAAIMFTDIAGYTAQMSKDEAVAISLLNKKESVLKPLIAKHNGTYVKSTGDGSLSHFSSAVDAATCAKRLQESIYDDKDLNVRVGVHLGDTIFEKGDIRGDGVNIASRLESMAVEGGVFVSKEVHDQLANQKEFEGVSLGLQSMKGVGRLIEVYGLKGDMITEPKPSDYQNNKVAVHSDDEVPSIAIIPFDNKGADEDVFYAYGISADLITDCSGAGLIRVESLDRIEKIENYDKLDITELATKLLVRYVATGTLWKMDDMFQLSIELYDTKLSKVIWSDRWEEDWDNLPTIKTNLSDGLLKALDTASKVEKKVDTTNPEAYEYLLKARYRWEKRVDAEDIQITRGLLNKAISLDDDLIFAKNLLGTTYFRTGNSSKALKIYKQNLTQSKKLGDKKYISISYHSIGGIHHSKGENDKAIEYYQKALIIAEERGDKMGIGYGLLNIAAIFENHFNEEYDNVLEYNKRALAIFEELEHRRGIAISVYHRGRINWNQCNYDKASEYYNQSLDIALEINDMSLISFMQLRFAEVYHSEGNYIEAKKNIELSYAIVEKLGDKERTFYTISYLGINYYYSGNLFKAKEKLEQALVLQKGLETYTEDLLYTLIFLNLTYKSLNSNFDIEEINKIIKKTEKIEFEFNYQLYQLFEDTSYLKTAYNQIQEKADNLEHDVAAKFLSYPIPKAIVEEWEKL